MDKTQEINIEDFAYNGFFLKIWWRQDKQLQSADIKTIDFEKWLRDTGRLLWCVESMGKTDDAMYFTGSMQIEQYWIYADYDCIATDLSRYMSTRWQELQTRNN